MSQKMTRLLGAGILCLFLNPSLANHPNPLPDVITTPNAGYHVEFTDDNPYTPPPGPGDDLNYFPTTQGQNAATALDNDNTPSAGNPNGYHAGYTDLGFKAPDFDGGDLDVLIFDCAPHGGCDSGNAPADRINLPAPTYISSAERNLRRVLGHELFHHVQFAYITFGKWVQWGRTAVEGMARMMEDEIFTDIDGDSTLRFWSQVKNYLDGPNQDLWQASYSAALWWKYLAEQFGTLNTEPQIGADVIRTFWEHAEDNNASPDTAGTVRETLRDFDLSRSLEDTFHDFTIANYTKEVDVTLIPDATKYRYIDENDGNGVSYSNVARSLTDQIPGPVGPNFSNVTRWGARYFDIDTTNCDQRQILGFRATGDYAAYSLVAVKNGTQVDRIYKGKTTDFAKALVQGSGPDAYTRLVGIVAGLDDPATLSYTFDCAGAKLQILRPTVDYQAYVGEHDDPDTFLVRLLVSGPTTLGDPTVEGLDPNDFEVYVGPVDPANQATVLSGANVQGEYWIVAQAPTKPANGTFNLTVRLGPSLSASRELAVIYEKLVLDQVLVVDRSGSMTAPTGAPKIDAAKSAARLIVDAAGRDDRIGLVSFNGDNVEPNDDTTLDALLLDATDPHRADVKTAIQALSAGGLTSIGDGLERGRGEIAIRGSLLGEDWMVLLSDGMENEAAFWNDIKAGIIADGVRVNTIALGPDTDQALLQQIASDTGGTYYYVDVGTVGSSRWHDLLSPAGILALLAPEALAAPADQPLTNRLADAYALSGELIHRHERLWEAEGRLNSGQVQSHKVEVAQGGIEDGVFSFVWDDPGSGMDVVVERPNGSVVSDGVASARIFRDRTHVVVRVPQLDVGTWVVTLTGTGGIASYLGILSGRDRQGPRMHLYFGQVHTDSLALRQNGLFLRGLPQPILVSLTDRKGPVRGARLRASVEHPDGRILELPLFDDGNHSDGNAGDGIYGNDYTRTTQASFTGQGDKPGNGVRGSYNVTVQGSGRDNQRRRFTRIRKGSFQVFERFDPSPDRDQDGMPDRYERLHRCLDPKVDDSALDPDGDGVVTLREWEIGTDPCNPDTDRGGESDGSELARGANPFDPADDALPRPTDVEVVDWVLEHLPRPPLKPNANLIRYPVRPEYALIRLHRAENPKGPFKIVAEFAPTDFDGLFMDQGLSNGKTYYYKIEPVDIQGNTGTPSHIFSGTPSADPFDPIGAVTINGGAPFTDSLKVHLGLPVDDRDVREMKISNALGFPGAAWEPYKPTVDWRLAPDKVPGPAVVYVKYRDAAGNESTVYQDAIQVTNPGTLGALSGKVVLKELGDPSGIYVAIAGQSPFPAQYTDASGGFRLPDLPSGRYTVRVSRKGYEDLVLRVPALGPGDSEDLGEITLTAVDVDRDAVPDVIDNCSAEDNPDQRNTDGDPFGNVCDTDLNNDGTSNVLDLGLFKQRFLSDDPDADFNGDGKVNVLDLGIMKRRFLEPPGPGPVD